MGIFESYNPGMHLVLDIASSAEFWRQRYPVERAPSFVTHCAPRRTHQAPCRRYLVESLVSHDRLADAGDAFGEARDIGVGIACLVDKRDIDGEVLGFDCDELVVLLRDGR